MRTLQLHDRSITLETAIEDESDVIKKLVQADETRKLYTYLSQRKTEIEALTAHHLQLSKTDSCVASHQEEWIHGRFNICIPVTVKSGNEKSSRTVLMRCPMHHMLAEKVYPGTVDEKISSEVATYAWIQDNCPDIPVPHLWGFGFSDGRAFTHAAHRPLYIRLTRRIRRFLCAFLRYPMPSHYTRHPSARPLATGYVLLDYIKPTAGTMLSNSWKLHIGDPGRRKNLFRGLARIMLSLARAPLPRIGSFRFHDDGTLTLSNRPLSCSLVILENNGAPRAIERDTTYTAVEPYIADLLTYHDNRFLHQPNAINDVADGQTQMATKTILRAISHHFFSRDFRNGPFALGLTDLHPSNLFVDEHWNIKYMVDLEWVCSLPVEMFGAPHWLTGHGVDEITDERLEEYNKVREEFMDVFSEEEEMACSRTWNGLSLAQLMQSGWNNGRYWYCRSLTSINGMYNIFEQHIRKNYYPLQLSVGMDSVISRFWAEGSESCLQAKLADKALYDEELRNIFSGSV